MIVVGAGLSGLAVAYFLAKKGARVTLYEKRKVGGGASGIAAGLLHPYPGKYKRLSWNGHEALTKSVHLLDEVEQFLGKKVSNRDGILVLTRTPREIKYLEAHRIAFGDVEKRTEGEYWIRSGITIDVPLYLEGLAALCKVQGVEIVQKEVRPEDAFDKIIFACGSESDTFLPLEEFERVGGQVLLCRAKEAGIVSTVGDGYLAYVSGEEFTVGATYERDFTENLSLRRAARKSKTPCPGTLLSRRRVPLWGTPLPQRGILPIAAPIAPPLDLHRHGLSRPTLPRLFRRSARARDQT